MKGFKIILLLVIALLLSSSMLYANMTPAKHIVGTILKANGLPYTGDLTVTMIAAPWAQNETKSVYANNGDFDVKMFYSSASSHPQIEIVVQGQTFTIQNNGQYYQDIGVLQLLPTVITPDPILPPRPLDPF